MKTLQNGQIPQCEKCGEESLTLYCNVWLCGTCFAAHINKQQDKQRALILEE
ncbi:hypothetical protein LCGC14_2272410 [marine sediment metagenome]|uniref:Uncharacterized protein n=1 Tax=marine sediment metagenome TaxID=412755 RepID=A0A0F9CWK8_9ZZZZ